ncbi:hypothetical protein BD779DRAFT_1664328 [Infundibulicybe gibba]|nr:hypothetical protein BD779DRAFT_1664328 [Infundibulicybe gibba]
MGNDVQVILDDKSSLFNYSGGKWTVHSDVRWLGGTSTYPQFADTSAGTFGSLDVTFQGTGITFIGNTPATSQSQNVTVTIDGGASYNSSYGDPHPQNYLQWYQSPVLPDGTHKITLDGVAGTSVDFALITAGPKTPFDTSQKILVDDDNPEIKYNGSWTRNGDPFVSSENPNGRPVHNGTHQSSTPGDTATFNFAGTSAAVYGIFSWTKTGSMSVTYTLDGVPTVNTYSVTPTTPEYINGLRQHQNYLLFSNDSLPTGPHALVINVTKSDGLVFVMDYITYSPSFTSLDTKPDLTQTSPTSSATSSKAKSGPPVGAIVGAIIGAIALLAVIAAVFLVLRRRKQRHDGGERPTRITPNTSYKIDPTKMFSTL